jgi:hypothetical protein
MTQGQTETLDDEFLFVGSSDLILFENDGDHWWDRDDFLGKNMITESPAETTLHFDEPGGSGAHYTMDVSITPGP